MLATPGPRSEVGSCFLDAPPPLVSAAVVTGGSHTGVSVSPPSSWPTRSPRSSSFSARLPSILTGAVPESRSGAAEPASRPTSPPSRPSPAGDSGGIRSGGWRPIRRSPPLLEELPSRMCRLSSGPRAPPADPGWSLCGSSVPQSRVSLSRRWDSRPAAGSCSERWCENAKLLSVSAAPPPALRHLIPDRVPSSPPPHRLLLIFPFRFCFFFVFLEPEIRREKKTGEKFQHCFGFAFLFLTTEAAESV